jgi:hypothetical protein
MSENFRPPISASVFNTSNGETIEGNQNGNGCVQRIAQKDRLSSRSSQLGEILDCWRQIRWYRYSIVSPNMSQRSQVMHASGNIACASSGGPLPSGRALSSFTWLWCRTKTGNLWGLARKRIRKRWMCQFEAEKGEKRENGRLFAWSLGTFSESYDQGICG